MTTSYSMINIDSLIPYARNARRHPEAQIDQIASSIREFGFLAPVVVDKDNTIIAGHGRLLAAKKLGMESIPCVIADHLTDAQRRAYVIIDNRLTDTSDWDKDLLQIELGDLAANFPDIDLALMGFSPPEIEELELPDLSEGNDRQPTKDEAKKTLREKFGVPPFSVLDARQGYWQERKRNWIALGIKSEIGRGGGQQVASFKSQERLDAFRKTNNR